MTTTLPKRIKNSDGHEFIFKGYENGYPIYMTATGRGYKHIFENQLKHYTVIEA